MKCIYGKNCLTLFSIVKVQQYSLFSPLVVLGIKKSAVTEISRWQSFAGVHALLMGGELNILVQFSYCFR